MHSGGGDRDFRAQLLRCDTCKEARKKCTYNVEECAETARTFESNGLPRRKGTERESHDGKTRMTRGFTSGAGTKILNSAGKTYLAVFVWGQDVFLGEDSLNREGNSMHV